MTDEVTIGLNLDTTNFFAEIDTLQQTTDAVVAEWKMKRREILSQMSELNMGISLMIRSLNLVLDVTGKAIHPVFRSLMTTVGSFFSLMNSMAIAYYMSGLPWMIAIGVVLQAVSFDVQMIQNAKLARDYAEVQRQMERTTLLSEDVLAKVLANTALQGGSL